MQIPQKCFFPLNPTMTFFVAQNVNLFVPTHPSTDPLPLPLPDHHSHLSMQCTWKALGQFSHLRFLRRSHTGTTVGKHGKGQGSKGEFTTDERMLWILLGGGVPINHLSQIISWIYIWSYHSKFITTSGWLVKYNNLLWMYKQLHLQEWTSKSTWSCKNGKTAATCTGYPNISNISNLKKKILPTLGNWPIIAPPQKKKLASTTPRN